MKIKKTFHHLALALTALLFFLSTVNLSLSAEFVALSFTVFVGTFFIYRLSVWVPIVSSTYPFINFYVKPNILEFIAYLLILISISYFLSSTTVLILIGWGILSITYFVNLKFGRFALKGLRSIPIIKPFLLAFMWTIIGYLFKSESDLFSNTNSIALISRFFIILIICLGVDLRDINKDTIAGTTTLATFFGFKNLKLLLLAGNIGIIALLYNSPFANPVDLLISVFLFFIILLLQINYNQRTFTLLLDGILFLYSLLLFIATYNRFC